MENNYTIFTIPSNIPVTITTDIVSLQLPDSSETLYFDKTYTATATDQYQIDTKGIKRRLFINTSIMFLGKNEIWLSDGDSENLSNGATSVEDNNFPEYITISD